MKKRFFHRTIAAVLAAVMMLSQAPVTAKAADTKSVTVSTQKELSSALKNTKVTTITIKTSKAVTLSTGKKQYPKKTLIVNSPKATINNGSTFQAIKVNDVAVYKEYGKNNNYTITDKKLSFHVTKKASVSKINVAKADVVLNAQVDGVLSNLTLSNGCEVSLTGDTIKAIRVINNGYWTEFKTSVPISLESSKFMFLELHGDARNCSIVSKADIDIRADKNVSIRSIHLSGINSKASVAAGGLIESFVIYEKAQVEFSGTGKARVVLQKGADGSSLVSSIQLNVTADAAAEVILKEGAESTILSESQNTLLDVKNYTETDIELNRVGGHIWVAPMKVDVTNAPEIMYAYIDNLRQITVKFNKPILATTEAYQFFIDGKPVCSEVQNATTSWGSKNAQANVTCLDYKNADTWKISLGSDEKGEQIYLKQGGHSLTVKDIKDTNGNILPLQTVELNYVDGVKPAIQSVVANSRRQITVTFTEPIDPNTELFRFAIDGIGLAEGEYYQYTEKWGAKDHLSTIRSTSDYVQNVWEITLGTTEFDYPLQMLTGYHELTVSGIRDYAGNECSSQTFGFYVGTDSVSPEIVDVLYVGNSEVFILFSENVYGVIGVYIEDGYGNVIKGTSELISNFDRVYVRLDHDLVETKGAVYSLQIVSSTIKDAQANHLANLTKKYVIARY